MVADIAYMQEQQQSISRMNDLFEAQRAAFRKAPMPSADERIQHLQALKQGVLKHQQALIDAIAEDFGRRSADETRLAEIMPSL
ncbi:MAG TPA: coniferyl-aldehyde dehydrogenase, partial [Pseudomonas pachastrellae]|nr:coniferyl-aldehyde dehydrogenase [Halopseudomonas pachastrellae]